MMDKATIRNLLQDALDAARTAGMEDMAEMEGVSYTGEGSKAADACADEAQLRLEAALGLRPKTVPVYDKAESDDGPEVGKAVMNDDGTAIITLLDSPKARAILDKLNQPGFGISGRGAE